MRDDLENRNEESIDQRVRAMLRTYEGPDMPVRRPSAHKLKREVLLRRVGIAGLCVLGALIGVAVFAIGGQSGSSTDAECPERLLFRGVPYTGNALVPGETITQGASLGSATEPGCSDELVAPAPDARAVDVRRILGVSPAVGVARSDRPELVYLADGRCSGTSDLLGCLRESLVFRGASYTPTFLNPETSGPAGLGPPLGEGTLTGDDGPTRTVTVARIRGVAPSVAVAIDGQPRALYIANGHCYLAQTARFLSCLRESP